MLGQTKRYPLFMLWVLFIPLADGQRATAAPKCDELQAALELPLAKASSEAAFESKALKLEERLSKSLMAADGKASLAVAIELSRHYQANHRLIEAVWTLERVAPLEYAAQLRQEIEDTLSNQPFTYENGLGGASGVKKVKLNKWLFGAWKVGDRRLMPGETWNSLWISNPYFEVAAYQVDVWLGLGIVPPTVLRTESTPDGPEFGSLQYFVDYVPVFDKSKRPLPGEMRLLDFLIVSQDRKSDNTIIRLGEEWVAPDNSVAFGMQGINGRTESLEDVVLQPKLLKRLIDMDLKQLDTIIKPLLVQGWNLTRKRVRDSNKIPVAAEDLAFINAHKKARDWHVQVIMQKTNAQLYADFLSRFKAAKAWAQQTAGDK